MLLQGGHPRQASAAVAIGLRLAPDDPGLLALRDAALAVPVVTDIHGATEGR